MHSWTTPRTALNSGKASQFLAVAFLHSGHRLQMINKQLNWKSETKKVIKKQLNWSGFFAEADRTNARNSSSLVFAITEIVCRLCSRIRLLTLKHKSNTKLNIIRTQAGCRSERRTKQCCACVLAIAIPISATAQWSRLTLTHVSQTSNARNSARSWNQTMIDSSSKIYIRFRIHPWQNFKGASEICPLFFPDRYFSHLSPLAGSTSKKN